jgi:putative nucleotidyltransferase with HDIG domain
VREAAARSRLLRENRDLVLRLSDSNRLFQGLLEVGSSLAGEPHVDRVLERLVASTRELCGAAAARAVVFGHVRGGGFVIEHAAGDGSEEIRGARLRPGEGIAGLAAETGEMVSVRSARDHARFSPRSDELRPDGAGFLCAPLRHGAVAGAVMAAGARAGAFEEQAREALSLLSRHASVSIENALHHERSVNFFTHTCNLLVSVLDRLDNFEPGHSHAVAALAGMVTRRMGMSDADRRTVHFAALLHDIGKLGLDPALLKGEGALTAQDAERIRQHPALGVQLLRPIALWEDVLSVIHAHHERWDGKGYPAGLAGEDIPLGARVVAVVESFDAMTRGKPYGRARTPEEGLVELESCAGTQFDPRIVRLFVAEYRRLGDPRQEAT